MAFKLNLPAKKESGAKNQEGKDAKNWMFPFLQKRLVSLSVPEGAEKALERISKSNRPVVVKNLFAAALADAIDQGNQADQAPGPDVKKPAKKAKRKDGEFWDRNLNVWPKTSVFRQTLPVFKKNLEGQFQMASLMAVMSAFLTFLYVWAVIDEKYLINFSVDSIVGIAALFFLIHNLRMQLRLIGSVESCRRYVLLDLSGFALSFLFRMWMPAGFDVSLAVFIIIFFIERKWFKTALDSCLDHL